MVSIMDTLFNLLVRIMDIINYSKFLQDNITKSIEQESHEYLL